MIAKDILNGKTVKNDDVKSEVKTTTATKKAEIKEEKLDLNNLTVAELKKQAKEKNITGYTTMKKAELIAALK
ncbi:MAG: Rho termination factor N-terminal domain-containing protein [Bacilli bacterium]|nr:Rho termination factor N-terminal domain-containing protein [Bacilli bacterium]